MAGIQSSCGSVLYVRINDVSKVLTSFNCFIAVFVVKNTWKGKAVIRIIFYANKHDTLNIDYEVAWKMQPVR